MTYGRKLGITEHYGCCQAGLTYSIEEKHIYNDFIHLMFNERAVLDNGILGTNLASLKRIILFASRKYSRQSIHKTMTMERKHPSFLKTGWTN